MNVGIVVSVSDKYLNALKPFAYLFERYWRDNSEVVIAGYKVPDFSLTNRFTYYSIAPVGFPKERWVDGFLHFLKSYDKDYFVLFLEDYWLCRSVNIEDVYLLFRFMQDNSNCLRLDLTGDRLYAGGMKDIGYYEHFDIIEAPQSQYQMSLQAGIWNRKLMIEVLEALPADHHSAWDVELDGTTIINEGNYRVYGTRQWPVRYVNGFNNTIPGINTSGFRAEDKEAVERLLHG